MDKAAMSTLPLAKIGGYITGCKCGRTHMIKTADIVFGKETIISLPEICGSYVPPGSGVLIVSEEGADDSLQARSAKILQRAGYRPSLVAAASEPACSRESIENIFLPEDARLIIGIGGSSASDTAKILGTKKNIPVIIIAVSPAYTGYLSPSAFYNESGLAEPLGCTVPAALLTDTDMIESSDDALASGFGSIMSKLIALFDWKVASLIDGDSYCPFVAEEVMAIIDSVLAQTEVLDRAEAPAVIMENVLRLSAIMQMTGAGLSCGAEVQATECMELLLRARNRPAKRHGENEFLLSTILSKVYIATLSNLDTMGFIPPPDNNLRMEKAKEYLGLSETAFLNKVKIYDPTNLKLNDYKLKEYSGELLSIIKGYDKKLTRAMRVFKRLYSDCGYSLIGYLDNADVSLSIGLGPDLKSRFTMLTQMKNMGLLDKYIV